MARPLMNRLDRFTAWVSVGVLVLTGVVLALPAYIQARNVLDGGGDVWLLLSYLLAEAALVVMVVLSVYAIMPRRLGFSPQTVAVLGIAAFAGMFFLILLILRGQVYAVIPILIYFVRIRRDLRDELPVAAGGRLKKVPFKQKRDRNAVTSRPPRSWGDPAAASRAKEGSPPAGAKRAKRAKRRRRGR